MDRIEGRAAAAVRNYFRVGSKVEGWVLTGTGFHWDGVSLGWGFAGIGSRWHVISLDLAGAGLAGAGQGERGLNVSRGGQGLGSENGETVTPFFGPQGILEETSGGGRVPHNTG